MADKVVSATSRKYHHKTRRGCLVCKQRRIKCDERKPICLNCGKKSIECSFLRLVPASVLKRYEFQVSSQHSLSPPSDPGFALFCRPNTIDREFFTRYISHTAPTITNRENSKAIYTSVIPRLSSTNSFLGHGILAIAYGHAARTTTQPDLIAKYLTDSAFHMNTTLSSYSQAITHLSQDNTPAVFGASVLICLYTFLSSAHEYEELLSPDTINLENRDSNFLDQLILIPVRLAHGIRGIVYVFWQSREWIATSSLSPLIQRPSPLHGPERLLFWAHIEDQELAKLGNLWTGNSVSKQEASILSQALEHLRRTFIISTRLHAFARDAEESDTSPSIEGTSLKDIHHRLSAARLDDLASIFTWYVSIPGEFLGMLQRRNLFAVVLLAHHAILLDRACAKKWWFCNLSSNFVSASSLILGKERRAWIEWPLKVVGS
ncbi:hypothetical protein BGW36DRAFT_151350 [Talaromyces proteolyticus]|uniref:Zn(2)-C6 fungal-type domain-containing protein n=1 Tax=Talaromyces proteolyticus TaxID=1131652 RepID=A0AAD4PZB3_9EURO|nr:uncharacterized protein BGW36DRAFT_151350 [Talaromyces proteolyticus]KAH8698846.1 hypothetical protein BGW36DRAFT_151350 [Talaromyces proteolyticus]